MSSLYSCTVCSILLNPGWNNIGKTSKAKNTVIVPPLSVYNFLVFLFTALFYRLTKYAKISRPLKIVFLVVHRCPYCMCVKLEKRNLES